MGLKSWANAGQLRVVMGNWGSVKMDLEICIGKEEIFTEGFMRSVSVNVYVELDNFF